MLSILHISCEFKLKFTLLSTISPSTPWKEIWVVAHKSIRHMSLDKGTIGMIMLADLSMMLWADLSMMLWADLSMMLWADLSLSSGLSSIILWVYHISWLFILKFSIALIFIMILEKKFWSDEIIYTSLI